MYKYAKNSNQTFCHYRVHVAEIITCTSQYITMALTFIVAQRGKHNKNTRIARVF